MTRYLNEIRLGEQKEFFRNTIHDVRERFDLDTQSRPVPHITLFGPYNTSQGYEVKTRTQRILSRYSVVPYRVVGFDSFPDSGTVYADVQPSQELQTLRSELADGLCSVAYDHRPWDANDSYDFHITIATNVGDLHSEILRYLRQSYDVDIELYATRVTALDGRKMMWEWDIPRKTALSAREATSSSSWKQTEAALQRQLKNGEQPRNKH